MADQHTAVEQCDRQFIEIGDDQWNHIVQAAGGSFIAVPLSRFVDAASDWRWILSIVPQTEAVAEHAESLQRLFDPPSDVADIATDLARHRLSTRPKEQGEVARFFEHLRANAPKSVDPAHSEDYKRGLADAHKLIVAAASASLSHPVSTNMQVAEDAARWRALLSGGRVKMQGSANVDWRECGPPREDEWIHFGAEFWSEYPGYEDFDCYDAEREAQTRRWFQHAITTLADRIRDLSTITDSSTTEGPCDLCAGQCRGHPLGDEEAWKPEPGSRAWRQERASTTKGGGE